MGKVALVLDEMPNGCRECRLLNWEQGLPFCKINEARIIDLNVRQNFCPLRNMPPKQRRITSGYGFSMLDLYYTDGWNKAIETIEGK